MFEVSGSSAGVEIMTVLAGIRSKIVMVAIHTKLQPTNLFHFFWKELEMLGCRVYEAKDYEQAILMLISNTLPLQDLITDIVKLDDDKVHLID